MTYRALIHKGDDMEDNTCKAGPVLSNDMVKAYFRNEVINEVANKVEATYPRYSALYFVAKEIAGNIRKMLSK